jgi:hypothetical protein
MSSYRPRTIFHRFHRACPGRSKQMSSYQTSRYSPINLPARLRRAGRLMEWAMLVVAVIYVPAGASPAENLTS